MRLRRCTKNEPKQQIFEDLLAQNIIDASGEALCFDSTSVKVHPNKTSCE